MKHLKQEFDKLSFKDTLIYSLAILSQLTAFVLLFCGMFIPPEGEIHDSVLTAFGLVLLFVGSLLGINMKYDSMTASFKRTVMDILSKQDKETLGTNKEEKIEPDKTDTNYENTDR